MWCRTNPNEDICMVQACSYLIIALRFEGHYSSSVRMETRPTFIACNAEAKTKVSPALFRVQLMDLP